MRQKRFFVLQPDTGGLGGWALTDANRKVFGLCKFNMTCQNTHNVSFHIIWNLPFQPLPILPANSLASRTEKKNKKKTNGISNKICVIKQEKAFSLPPPSSFLAGVGELNGEKR